MKKITNILLALLFASITLTSCDGLLKVDSTRYVFEDEYGMKSTNDSLYAMFGVFSQLEKLADEYVLLGELRADLMDVTTNSNPWLKEINEFNVSAENPYADKRQYYAVINNCNYIIKNIDTTIVKNNEKVMYKVLSATKAIRAWTYMQLALNYKTVVYYSEPILKLEDASINYPVLEFNQLADLLIEDLAPYKDYAEPSFGNLHTARISDSFFPIRFLLGDLYLWTGRYEEAANEYRDLIFYNRYLIFSTEDEPFISSWNLTNSVFNGSGTLNWLNCFSSGSREIITNIAASNEFGNEFMLDSLVKDYQLTTSTIALTNWDSQRYMASASLDTLCDMRKIESVMANFRTGTSGWSGSIPGLNTKNYLSKIYFMNRNNAINKRVMPYRVALLYLRYAEAVNRLGKVNMAMAVLKYGLTPANISNPNIIPTAEIGASLPSYMNFTDARFIDNLAIRARSLGRPDLDTRFVIPSTLDSVAKIHYMEDLICNEYALETAFEGNRFHDLMRIAIRRDSTEYLSKKVAAKHIGNQSHIEGILSNRNNWYLK